jgi:hypothetical protein
MQVARRAVHSTQLPCRHMHDAVSKVQQTTAAPQAKVNIADAYSTSSRHDVTTKHIVVADYCHDISFAQCYCKYECSAAAYLVIKVLHVPSEHLTEQLFAELILLLCHVRHLSEHSCCQVAAL